MGAQEVTRTWYQGFEVDEPKILGLLSGLNIQKYMEKMGI
jgi:hypothetical protein